MHMCKPVFLLASDTRRTLFPDGCADSIGYHSKMLHLALGVYLLFTCSLLKRFSFLIWVLLLWASRPYFFSFFFFWWVNNHPGSNNAYLESALLSSLNFLFKSNSVKISKMWAFNQSHYCSKCLFYFIFFNCLASTYDHQQIIKSY